VLPVAQLVTCSHLVEVGLLKPSAAITKRFICKCMCAPGVLSCRYPRLQVFSCEQVFLCEGVHLLVPAGVQAAQVSRSGYTFSVVTSNFAMLWT
jgi:hypothetical protein